MDVQSDIEWESVACDLCGASRCSTWKEAAQGAYTGTWRLVRCDQCGLVYVNPRPAQRSMARYYSEAMYAGFWTGDRDRLGSLRDGLVRLIAQESCGYRLDSGRWPSPRHLLRSAIACPFRHKLCRIPPYQPSGRLLDVGSGSARDLTLAKALGWETYGLDIAETAVARGQQLGHNMHCGTLEEASYPDDFFHAVMMMDVIEHLHNPRNTLAEVSRILRSGGALLIRVPDVESVQARWSGDRWWPANHLPHHLFFFSSSTMQRLLKDLGFRIVRLSHATSPRCVKRYFDYLWVDRACPKLGQLPSWARVMDSLTGALVYVLIEAFGLGDELVVMAEKPP